MSLEVLHVIAGLTGAVSFLEERHAENYSGFVQALLVSPRAAAQIRLLPRGRMGVQGHCRHQYRQLLGEAANLGLCLRPNTQLQVMPAARRNRVRRETPMTTAEFVDDLEVCNQDHLRRIDALRDASCSIAERSEVVRRLKVALRQELEAAEIAALWMPTADELEFKLALGKLCGDETRHYSMICARLTQLGEDVSGDNPLGDGRSKLYDYLASLQGTVERVAAAQFTREAIGYVRNEQFIAFCERAQDVRTARLYRLKIQPDEASHVEVGRRLLMRYVVSDDDQRRARGAALHTLTIAEGAVSMLIRSHKMSSAPGC